MRSEARGVITRAGGAHAPLKPPGESKNVVYNCRQTDRAPPEYRSNCTRIRNQFVFY